MVFKRRRRGGFRRRFKRVRRGIKRHTRRSKGRRITSVRQKTLLRADRQFVKLRDTYYGAITNTGGIATTFSFVGNSIFDVLQPSSGNQRPTGFNQWYSLYKYCCVLGSKLTITACNDSPSNWIEIGIFPSTESAATVQPIGFNLPYWKYRMMGAPGSNKGVVKLSNYMSTQKIFGRKNVLQDTDFHESSAGAVPPNNKWFWHIVTKNESTTGSNASLGPIHYRVDFVSYCCFTNPVALVNSNLGGIPDNEQDQAEPV